MLGPRKPPKKRKRHAYTQVLDVDWCDLKPRFWENLSDPLLKMLGQLETQPNSLKKKKKNTKSSKTHPIPGSPTKRPVFTFRASGNRCKSEALPSRLRPGRRHFRRRLRRHLRAGKGRLGPSFSCERRHVKIHVLGERMSEFSVAARDAGNEKYLVNPFGDRKGNHQQGVISLLIPR